MEGAFQVCRNCKRRVASAHLTLHEAHCLLFLVLCPECKEPVPQAKMDEHCETGHQQVGCAMCQQSIQKHLLEFHETTECQERPTECKFCGVAVRLGNLEIHEHHCGSRTELCLDCGQVVVVRGLARHKDACRREQAQHQRGKRISAPENNISRRDCNQMIPGNKYLHHLDKCHTVSESAKYPPIGEPTISPPSLPSQAAEDQTSTAERDVRPKKKNMNRFPLLSENSTKQAPSDTKPQITSPTEDEAAYDILRRCPQCDILLPLPTLNQHQVPSFGSFLTWLQTIWTGLREIQNQQAVCRHCHWKSPSLAPPLCDRPGPPFLALPTWFICMLSQRLTTFEGRATSFISVSSVWPRADYSKCFKQLSK